MFIVSAPWLVPVSDSVIQDGSIVIDGDRIEVVGRRDDITRSYQGLEEKRYKGVLMPGLINAHMHLELSYLGQSKELSEGQPFTDWISTLLEKRGKVQASEEEIVNSITATIDEQYQAGVVLIADIGNTHFQELRDKTNAAGIEVYRMLEFLGPDKGAVDRTLLSLKSLNADLPVTAHAPYSTVPVLLQTIKHRCRESAHLFSIHTAESEGEQQFISSLTGPFRDFLEKRNSWDGSFEDGGLGAASTVLYFEKLNILDDKTLLVHCTHVSTEDIQLIVQSGAKVCLCPGSNQFLKVGVAPVTDMVEAGILPCLGTDSITSNLTLDLWREMEVLSRAHRGVSHDTILKMATIGGARAMHRECDYGSLSVGKRSNFIHVSSERLLACQNREEVIRVLVTAGKPAEIGHVVPGVSQ